MPQRLPALPAEFGHLSAWLHLALPTEDQRMRARLAAAMTDLQDFYNALLPEMDRVVTHLDQWPLREIPAASRPLLYLGLMFMEAAMSVEFFREPDVPEALSAEHMELYSGRAERGLPQQ